MANKNVQLSSTSGDNLFPITLLSNITVSAGDGIAVSGNTIGCKIAVAGTTATATTGISSFDSSYFTVNANGFVSPKLATTAQKGVASFSSIYFTVSSGVVTPKTASSSQKGVVQLATSEEATAGNNNTKAVTPFGLKAAITAAGNVSGLNDLSDCNVANLASASGNNFAILIYDAASGEFKASNWLTRLFNSLGSGMSSIGIPFDENDFQ